MKRQSNEEGFTLIESLIVLLIFIVLSLALVVNMKPAKEHAVISQFFEQLEKDILYAQQHAVVSQNSYYFIYSASSKQYSIRSSGIYPQKLIERAYNEEITMTKQTMPYTFYFDPQGNISASGTILVQYKEQHYLIKFYLGKGRFHVEKV
ncbi:type II secretion system GspH family protein [Metabacillus sp. GX 13764]|uniref:competence type IV pilus minor pilin ComGD n=1 Tax=Metabacillus kandeliae TaxID=2900151 RepID=UPI001E434639|nr:competence type IV pilus minor pilin ComGD [Metabacillus kandeliae]MCD7033127.1 type II secretion system GspH family protein [Metabacillus kandeliae]